jgi:hypothetical protein
MSIKAGFTVEDWGFTKTCNYMCLYNYDGTNTIGYMGRGTKPDLDDNDKYLVAVFKRKEVKDK